MSDSNEIRISKDVMNAALSWSAHMHAVLAELENNLGEPGFNIFRVTSEVLRLQTAIEEESYEAHKMQERFGFSVEQIQILEIIRSNVFYRIKHLVSECINAQKSSDYYNLLEELDSAYNVNKIREILLRHGVGAEFEALPKAADTETPAQQPQPEGRSFSERLENHRIHAKMSQRKLGENAGLRPSHVNQLEQGKVEPRLSTILALADALGVDPCALIPKGRGRR